MDIGRAVSTNQSHSLRLGNINLDSGEGIVRARPFAIVDAALCNDVSTSGWVFQLLRDGSVADSHTQGSTYTEWFQPGVFYEEYDGQYLGVTMSDNGDTATTITNPIAHLGGFYIYTA